MRAKANSAFAARSLSRTHTLVSFGSKLNRQRFHLQYVRGMILEQVGFRMLQLRRRACLGTAHHLEPTQQRTATVSGWITDCGQGATCQQLVDSTPLRLKQPSQHPQQ